MTFIRLAGHDDWYEWDKVSMKCITFGGSSFDIDNNSIEFMESVISEAKDWHELYKKTGYVPLRCDEYTDDVWLSPDGEFFVGDCHEVQAEGIYNVIYGNSNRDICFGDLLISNGWVKLTTSAMLHYYRKASMYDGMTNAQHNAAMLWCEVHHIAYV